MENIGVVIIGRNEGERLVSCFSSLPEGIIVVYVDSNSSDDSVNNAKEKGYDVVELDMSIPFTAARARNEGFFHLMEKYKKIEFVQFVDGDCIFESDWLVKARAFLQEKEYSLVCGRLYERYPEKSIYNKICNIEWNGPVGDIEACGGIFMINAEAYKSIGGMNKALIAGEEPEMCLRLRERGYKLYRMDEKMALHDVAMYHISQWYKRSKRSGFAFALGKSLHGKSNMKYNVNKIRSIVVWGLMPVFSVLMSIALENWLYIITYLFVLLLQIIRVSTKFSHIENKKDKLIYSTHCMFSKIPQFHGILKFRINRLLNRKDTIIEHKVK